ncbi:tetratricopeptide repeat protein [Actinoplanes sp. NBRC 103695]|uniref:tetratricopeptide repeat protein n=1 Tax=Actinoplanes sp. NBRC 103695 TaxID=3032202 RepID=UPI0024A4B6EC|nr:tetratricopeptide repeat protein [Actinoplanes sp. NBRC 103695]GLY98088.1 hypothetical protein Acsp02_53420 [Actinoplanes sp. NBRC 103695]
MASSLVDLPDPDQASDLDGSAERLRLLKAWAGGPSYEIIKDRVNAAWTAAGRPAAELARRSTVADCFRLGRRRVNADLIVEIVRALHPDDGYAERWRQALRAIGGELEAVSQVRVQDTLPPLSPQETFVGRVAELDAARGGATIRGMAGVGKTQLAIQVAQLLEGHRVLFVDLRGFHPDPAQPPADPAAVLDGFLRLLGVPGQAVPHGLDARAALYQERLAGQRAVVLLDNAAGAAQVRPLLPAAPGCVALVTSRRSLTELPLPAHIDLGALTPDESVSYLDRKLTDAASAARIAARCGHLPLALGLIAAHIRNTPGWTLADHADRLDERHRERRLDSGVELAFDLSYQRLPATQRRLLRLAALHPGHDIDGSGAAALLEVPATDAHDLLATLRDEHLLGEAAPGRYVFHDLVRAYAISKAHDEDRPADRRAALTRLFDHYVATSAAAMDALVPAEKHQRPRVPSGRTFDITEAQHWLDTELPSLMSVALHGSPQHAVLLSATLFRHLNRGHLTEAVILHDRAQQAAAELGDLTGRGHALTALGVSRMLQGRADEATVLCKQALALFRESGDASGQGRVLVNLGSLADWAGDYDRGAACFGEALGIYRELDDLSGMGRALNALGDNHGRQGDFAPAIEYYIEALSVCRRNNDPITEGAVLGSYAHVQILAGDYEPAAVHYAQALEIYRRTGDRTNEARAMNGLGQLDLRLERYDSAAAHFEELLSIVAEIGLGVGRLWAHNGLGEVAEAAGRFDRAAEHFETAHAMAVAAGDSIEQARAGAGLERAHSALGSS